MLGSYTPGDQFVRGQNITVTEGEKNRIADAQRKRMEDRFLRDQLAQQQSQFGKELEWAKQRAAEAAAEHEADRWFGIGESLLRGGGTALGGYLGRG